MSDTGDLTKWPASKYTPEIHRQIVNLLRAGNFRDQAASAAGIGPATFRRWMKLGADGQDPYATLRAECAQAEAQSEARDIALIGAAGEADWKAAAWRQERKAPARWGQRVRIEVQNELAAFFDKLERVLPAEYYELALKVASGDIGEGEIEAIGGEDP